MKTNNYLITVTELKTLGYTPLGGVTPPADSSAMVSKQFATSYYQIPSSEPWNSYIPSRLPKYQDFPISCYCNVTVANTLEGNPNPVYITYLDCSNNMYYSSVPFGQALIINQCHYVSGDSGPLTGCGILPGSVYAPGCEITYSTKRDVVEECGTTTTTTTISPTVYITAVVSNGSIYRSTNGGSTFSAISGTAGQYWYDVSMSTNGKYQLAAANYRWLSSDYGATWSNQIDVFPNLQPIAIGVSGTGQYQLALPDYSYIAYSGAYGTSWTNSFNSGQIYWGTGDISKTGQYALAGGNSGSVKVSSNYGVDFFAASGSINDRSKNWLASAVSGTGQYMIICQNGSNIWKSSDYGSTWATISSAGTGVWRAAAISSTGQYMLAGDYGGYLHYSDDYGVNWQTVVNTFGVKNWRAASISSTGQYMVAAIQNGEIWFSNSYGIGWTPLAGAGSRNWTGVAISS